MDRFQGALKHKILEQIDIYTQYVASGGAPDYAGYQYRVGYIAGLKDALTLADNIQAEWASGED